MTGAWDGSPDRRPADDVPLNTSMTRCCDDQLNPPWLPLSECTIAPLGERNAIALRNAAAASPDFIREPMEYPTILLEYTSLTAHR